ncbi:MAG TPA: ATP-binding protein [Rhodocyclaceae bacterium]|nr:ATP-binding protein [Rhodocyclaceae bacterium]HMZ84756.1 ATP-binding protein [Rhodocyclaceae bacterium]HNA03282.1 ATP-binding protein [Rhodocyclaceae bacterium]HNB78749.1 ATP-binding protein [Rhodocyclaceae bacterium]HNC60623.1 ATP-binding protein [Rhodocyclaceae bacterium]
MPNFRLLRSVRGRLLLAAVVVEAVMLTLLIGNSLRLLREHMAEQERSHARQMEPVLNAALVAPLAQRDFATLQAILDESRGNGQIEYLAVLDIKDRLLAVSGWPRDRALPAPNSSLDVSGVDEQARYDVARPISLAGQRLGTLRFGLDMSHIAVANRQLMLQGVAIALGELVLSTVLLTLLGLWLTRHLVALTRASEQVADGNLSPLHMIEGDDELGRLGAAFNVMSRTVEERIRDLTQTRDAQRDLAEELEVSRARLVSLLSAMKFGVLFVDSDGCVRFANPEFRGMWGLDFDPVGSAADTVFVRASGIDLHGRPPASASDFGAQPREFVFADGRIVMQRAYAVSDSEARRTGRMWIYEDVTQERYSAQQLRAAKEAAEAANVAKAAFLATMSHEIRTPMNGIIGMTELALSSDPDHEVRGYLDWVKSSAESLMVILNDILDFSKIEAGRLELEAVEFDLRLLLEDTLAVFSRQATEKGIALRLDRHALAPHFIRSDPVRLRQVLTNLVSNAVKFTERGAVTVTLAQPRFGEQPMLTFKVADSGIGIAEDKLDHVFTPFSQADSSTTRKYGGTGLGLAIVARLVALLGGTIRVTSEAGRGSCFEFDIAFTPAQAPEQGHDSLNRDEVQASCSGGRVLVVEDTPVNQALVTRILRKNGYQVTLARDGLEALDAYRRGVFDVILMDMQMPHMDGLEATARIRAMSAEARRIPIIALTANAMASDRERCLAAGMDDFISKPFRANEVISVIRRFVADAADAGAESA